MLEKKPFFFLKIGEVGKLEERLLNIQVSETPANPFQIHLTLIPSNEFPMNGSFLHQAVLLEINMSKGLLQKSSLDYSFLRNASRYCGYIAREHRTYSKKDQSQETFSTTNELESITFVVYSPLCLLANGSHARIFSVDTSKSTPAESENNLESILKKILLPYESDFKKFGIDSIVYDSFLPKEPILYVTQYNENDLCFLLRLCEQYGVYFTQEGSRLEFRHRDSSLPSPFSNPISHSSISLDVILSQEDFASHTSYQLANRDLNYLKSSDSLKTVAQKIGDGKHQVAIFTHYDNDHDGMRNLKNIASSIEYMAQETHFWSHLNEQRTNRPLVGMRVGDLLVVNKKKYFLHDVSWSYQSRESVGNIQTSAGSYYANMSARDISDGKRYSPPITYAKPKVSGYHRAIVIAPTHTNPQKADSNAKLGRIKVRFLWDQDDQDRTIASPERTCWLRLMMPFAGNDHGFYVMPKIGDEVIVDFEDGDIDRPVCLGSVYNIDSLFLFQSLTDQNLSAHIAQMETTKVSTPKNLSLEFWESSDEEKQRIQVSANEKIVSSMNVCEQEIDYNVKSEGTIHVHAEEEIEQNSNEQVVIRTQDNAYVSIQNDGTVVVEAKDKIAIRCGKSRIDMDTGEINIRCGRTSIKIDEQGKISIDGSEIKINMQALAKVKAGKVEIN